MKNFYFRGDKPIPRWIIFALDVFLICQSFTFTYFIVSRFQFSEMSGSIYLLYLILFFIISLPFIYLMRLHTGLLRYSNTTDMLRVFKAIFFISLTFGLITLLIREPKFESTNLLALLLINFFIASSSLIMMRIFAKATFHSLMRRTGEKKTVRVLIFGSDKNAVLVKRALENSDETNYEVEGFVDVSRQHLNNNMEQKRVYHLKDLKKLKERKQISQIVMVNEDLSEKTKKLVLDHSLRNGIKVITVPPIQTWLNNKLEKQQIKALRIEDLLQRKPILMDPSSVSAGLKGKRILVTGAAGSIGSEIVRQVLAFNPSLVILCDLAESPLYEAQMCISEQFPDASIEVVIADVRNRKRMDKLFHTFQPQIVFHAAAYKHVPLMENNPFEAIDVNIHGTKNIADLSVVYNIDKFVMISTDKAVNPTNIMGASKRIAEIYTQCLNQNQSEFKERLGLPINEATTKFITTRFGNVLGSNGSVIPRFRSQIEKGGPITVTDKEITRYFMTISEAVQLVLEAGIMGKGGEIFVFDMGSPVKIYDMAEKMIQLAGLEVGKDIKIVITGLRPGEKLYEELLNTAETTMPTYHEKIKIAHVRTYTYHEVQSAIDRLMAINETQNNMEIVKQMKILVPEFISKNSIYEKLDDIIQKEYN